MHILIRLADVNHDLLLRKVNYCLKQSSHWYKKESSAHLRRWQEKPVAVNKRVDRAGAVCDIFLYIFSNIDSKRYVTKR